MIVTRLFVLMGLLIVAGALAFSAYATARLLPVLNASNAHVEISGGVLSWALMAALVSMLLLLGGSLLLYLHHQLKKRLAKRSYELEHLTRLLKKSERHLQAVLDGTHDGIISIDEQGRIENFNAGAAKMFGYQRAEVVGCNIDIIIPDDEKYQHRQIIKGAALKGKKVIQRARQLYGQKKDGQLIPVEVTLNRIVSDDQVKYVGVIRDVSDLTVERNNLATALTEAESANESKNRLLSSASHELRTPLNAILGFSEILMDDFDAVAPALHRQYLKDIHRSAELLLLLVNDVLDYAKLDSGLISLDVKPVDFSVLLNESLRMMTSEISKKNIHCVVDVKSNHLLQADYLRLQQVVINLLSNACKYNIDGGLIKVVSEKRGAGCYCIDVIDTGIGIDEKKLPELYQPFARLHDLRLPIEGSGIGLSLCKNLIESMGGTLQYQNNIHSGSTFTVCMPLATSGQSEPRPEKNARPEAVLRRQKILYVEDNEVNVRLMKAMLMRLSVEMDSVSSAEDCFDYLQHQCPDIILMDINLPGMCGCEAAELIRKQSHYDKVPIIAVSASISDCQEGGGQVFFEAIAKPFRAERIRAVIESATRFRTAL